MEILLLRTWLSNIGNGFIDMGAKKIVEKAAPDAHVYEVSGYPNYAADKMVQGQLAGVRDVLGDREEQLKDFLRRRRTTKQSVVNVAEYIDADVAVLPGCVLYKHVLSKYRDVLKSLSDRGVEILFLGAGGGDYTVETRNYVKGVFNELDSPALLTRDKTAYDRYESNFEFAHNGIDCAFFIDEWFSPPLSSKDFSVFTFDKQKEPDALYQQYSEVIRPDHTPFGYSLPFDGDIPMVWHRYKSTRRRTNGNVFVSDSPKDYLFWYSNADVTHSDRVHACIPTLVYGNRTQFHYETPRASLFDQLPLEGITEKPVSLDSAVLERAKRAQVAATEEALSLVST